jgi:hypothetical protein
MTAAPYRVEASRLVATDAATAFACVADPRTHPRWIPMTVIASEHAAAPRVGEPFTMVTGPFARRTGRGFPDRMTVTAVEPPAGPDGVGRTRVRKDGPFLRGDAGFDVVPVDAGRCRVVWWEEAYLAGPWPRRLNALAVGVVLRLLLRVSLRRLARDLSDGAGA